jgi:hypothetical protein
VTPPLPVRGRHRERVSVAAALTMPPARGRLGLYYQTIPNGNFPSGEYAVLLRAICWHLRHPIVLLHDRGQMHKGEAIRAVQASFPRLHLHFMPAYAPEYNPPECLWTFEKGAGLANHPPMGVVEIESTLHRELEAVRKDQDRLRSFFLSSPLPWNDTPLLI